MSAAGTGPLAAGPAPLGARPGPVTPAAVAVAPSSGAARAHRPPVLVVLACVVAAALLAPLAFLVVEAFQDGWAVLAPLVFRSLTFELVWNTVALTVVVTALCALIGTLCAWFLERTEVPGRRLWAVLVVVPLGIPDFVVSFGWRAIFPSLGGFWAAVLVMTLAVYPLVFLPVAASLRSADPAQEEVARGLGLGRWRTFWSVTLGQARGAIFGGCVLVALVLLAEYGAFEILGYRTLTTEVFTELNIGDISSACALSLILVLLSVAVLGGEGLARGSGRLARVGAGVPRPLRRERLGRAALPVTAGLAVLVVLALGVPVGAVVWLLVRGGTAVLPPASLLDALGHTFGYSAAAGILATAAAIPIALLVTRHPGRLPSALERSNFLVLAVPGVVIALAFTYISERYAAGFLYHSAPLLVATYAVMFFPMALVSVRASVARAPVRLEEIAASLGSRRLAVLWRVTLPLVGPGLAAAFSLVFLQAATELTATLIMIPTGVQTLATQFWAYESNLSYSQAAPYAAVMMALASVPSYVLGRWFDRMPARAAAVQ